MTRDDPPASGIRLASHYVLVMITEAVVIVALWVAGRLFS
jgi:hypothetical protein